MATQNTTPANAWDSADQLDGLDILDKAQLIDVPFRITGVQFSESNTGALIAYIDAEKQDGEEFTFLDSSTGVKAQLTAYLTGRGLDACVESGDYQELSLVAPNGLRVSEYDVPERSPNGQEIRGKFRKAKTFYLTTSGRRNARKSAPAAAPAKRPTAK